MTNLPVCALPSEEARAIYADALEKVLRAVTQKRQTRHEAWVAAGSVLPPFPTPWRYSGGPLPTRDQSRAKRIAEGKPEALEDLALWWLGEQLYRLTGDRDGMRDVLEEVANRDDRQGGHWLSICNARWDSIGNWYA